jgi:hypothetical protein
MQRTDSRKPIHFMADNFHAFPAGNQFCDLQQQQGSRYRLVAENGIPLLICFNCSEKLFFPRYQQNTSKPISAISFLLREPH